MWGKAGWGRNRLDRALDFAGLGRQSGALEPLCNFDSNHNGGLWNSHRGVSPQHNIPSWSVRRIFRVEARQTHIYLPWPQTPPVDSSRSSSSSTVLAAECSR